MKLRVMVIDDLDSARQMVKRALGRSFEVYDFASVAEALPALDRAEFDVIVTDLRMPGIDGLEGLKRFQAKVPEIPVDHHDRLRHRGDRGGGHEGRRLRLPQEALRSGGARGDGEARRGARRAACGRTAS